MKLFCSYCYVLRKQNKTKQKTLFVTAGAEKMVKTAGSG